MTNRIQNLLLHVLIFCGLCSCKCDTVLNKTFYDSGKVKTITTENCKHEILKYEHYTMDGQLAFSLNYVNSVPQEPLQGRPWVHLVWNTMDPFLGDTINLEIDLIKPPKMEVKL